MARHDAIHPHLRFSRWLERVRDLAHRTRRHRKATSTTGYNAFWRDLVAAWLVALLLAGTVLAVQSANTPRPGLAIGATLAQAPRGDNAARVRGTGDHDPGDDDPECSDLDYAYLRC